MGGIVSPDTPNPLTTTTIDGVAIEGIEAVFANVVSLLIPFGGIVLFVMLMYGGLRYITAGANPKAVEQARGIITFAILGMILLSMAFLILVIISLVTGANITRFRLSF